MKTVGSGAKTTLAKVTDPKAWHLVDASGWILGRLATRVATILMGKHKPTYTAHLDTGDFVIVVNAKDIRVTGNKLDEKEYQWYTDWPSGLKTKTLRVMMDQKPEEVIRLAVERMLPKTKLGRHMIKKLKVYAGADHPHEAQQPAALKLK
ncbi:MAG: 50S ribosomal protein L13 [Planctomycetes bacterium RBG_16_59_8]|nr:MAG: 50S ribosomal protein L13 [Planctomycetes bacterium RBG_16_59_8]